MEKPKRIFDYCIIVEDEVGMIIHTFNEKKHAQKFAKILKNESTGNKKKKIKKINN